MRLPLDISWWWVVAALAVSGIGWLFLRWLQSKNPTEYQEILTTVRDQAAARYLKSSRLDVDARGQPDWRIDVLFGLILIALAVAALANWSTPGSLQRGPGRISISLFVGFVGLLIFLSCFFLNHSYLFKGLRAMGQWGIKGRWQSILLGCLLMSAAIVSLLSALGLFWK